jgi:hypothetical protein
MGPGFEDERAAAARATTLDQPLVIALLLIASI